MCPLLSSTHPDDQSKLVRAGYRQFSHELGGSAKKYRAQNPNVQIHIVGFARGR